MAADFKKYIAEFFGTFALVFIGAGAVTANALTNGALGLIGVAFAHGLVLMSMIYALGHVSGGHFNPAVTVSMVATGKQQAGEGLFYIVSQLLGAAVAGFLLLGIFPSAVQTAHLGVTDLGFGFTLASGILLEAVLTFFLVLTIFGVAVDKRAVPGMHGFAIGLVLAFDILMGGAFTGAAMNPARAFGPALASGYWATQIVYWVGPIIGALVAGFGYSYFLMGKGKK